MEAQEMETWGVGMKGVKPKFTQCNCIFFFYL